MLRKKCRTQSLWNLHLAGDWHVGCETMPLGASSHMMRVMLISNLAVDQVSYLVLRPPISVSHKGRATCSPAVRQRYAGAPAAVAPGRERIEKKGVACILSGFAGAVLQGGAVTGRALVVSAPWGGRNSVGRPIDFPLFCRRRPHQCLHSRNQETSLSKGEMMPDIDHMDIGARQENLSVRGEPIMLQMCVVPAYALTIHKTQALSIKHLVIGCLEGVFAMGQVSHAHARTDTHISRLHSCTRALFRSTCSSRA